MKPKTIFVWGMALLCTINTATAQTFGPYFRWPLETRTNVNSFFDNDRTTDGHLTRFDHRLGPPTVSAGLSDCSLRFSCYDRHEGIDLQAGFGVRIYAAAAGKVICKANPATGLTRLSILHNNNFVTDYLHMQSFAIKPGTNPAREWQENDLVNEGDFIAEVGDRGAGGQPHLHFGVRKHNSANNCDYTWSNFVDPLGKLYAYPSFFRSGPNVDVNSTGFIEMAPVGDPLLSNTNGTNGHSLHTYANQTNETEYNGGLWSTTINQHGFFKVSAHIPSYASAKVKYHIYYHDFLSYNYTSSIKEIDQSLFRNQWVDLGTYYFLKQGQAALLLTDMKAENRSASDIVAFDEVKWEFQNTSSSPSTIVGNQSSVNISVPANQVITYTAPNYIYADNVYIPVSASAIFASSGTITLRPGFYAAGGEFSATTFTGAAPLPISSSGTLAYEQPQLVNYKPPNAKPFPNPFTGEVLIGLNSEKKFVHAGVYDANGRLAQTLVQNKNGKNTCKWNGKNSAGVSVPPGLYYVTVLYADNSTETIKLVKQ
jgi:murein DD-endopeptidase MepM/ murein hydrolase activator NlpD